jgi:peptidyl-prolyl cis-trans isomerase D
MLDAMRRGVANLFVKLLLGLLIISFALWGIGDYVIRGPSQSTAVATVGKTEISREDFQKAVQDEIKLFSRQLGGRTLTVEEVKRLEIPQRARDRLIGTTAIDLHAKELGVTTSNDILRAIVRGEHPILYGPDGRLDKRKYAQVIREAGYRHENDYEQARRRDLWREQLTETLAAGVTPQQYQLDMLQRFRDESRVIEYIIPDFKKLVILVEPTEPQLKEFFEANQRNYLAPEERKANLLLLTREEVRKLANVTDAEVKAAYDAARESYDAPEKRRVSQLTFPDKAAAEKAYAELSKAKNFEDAAAKLGFPASDVDLGLLTSGDMIDPKIADAAFKLKLNELSRPVEGQYSVVLLRITEIQAGKKRSFDDVKSEIRDQIAGERIGQQITTLYEKVEAGRAKGTPLKEIAAELKLPFQEIAITPSGKSADGKNVVPHADAPKIAKAIFEATQGVEADVVELGDSGIAWFDLVSVTPQRQRNFEEVAKEVRAEFIETQRSQEIANRANKEVERLRSGESLAAVAKSLGAKVERTPPIKRVANPLPAGLTPDAVQQAFALPKLGAASEPTADGTSRVIFRVADVIPAAAASAEETEALKAGLARQLRVDLLAQYVAGLRARYGYTLNDKAMLQALGERTGQDGEN